MLRAISRLALLVGLALIICASKSAHCSLFLPEQFHCSTELWFFHRELSLVDTFFIDEYVDRPNRRSSLRLTNEDKGVDLIYYNELLGKEEGPILRQFVQYNPNRLTCKREDIYGWHLDQVRRLAIGILPTDHVSPKNVDIAIGSSGLLYAIESRMDELEYRGAIFDESRLTYVNVYELSILKPFGVAYNSGKDLLVQVATMPPPVKIITSGNVTLGMSLAQMAKLVRNKLTIVSIRICSVSAARVKRATQSQKPYQCQVDVIEGHEQDLLASIDLVEGLVSNSLIGQPLEKAEQFEFELNPFAQPPGLGCGQESRANLGSLGIQNIRPRTFKARADQFSAEYFSMRGLQGLAFVAFDGQRQVMRHDRGGRKNVYDLKRGRSYHVDDFHPIQSMFDESQATSCVELEIGDDMLLVDDSISPMARLLGIDLVDEASHIGSKTINDETFSVYELELEQDKNSPSSFNLPIVMEPIDFVMPIAGGQYAKKRHRYFMTYYVLEVPSASSPTAANEAIKIPRFVELWELSEDSGAHNGSTTDRERVLINLLEFTQFSWSLSIQPEESSSDEDLSRLFSVESCAQERSEQLLLTFNTIYSEVPAKLIESNRQLIRETFHEQLATILDIPRLNLLSLEVHFGSPFTGIWLIEARLAELIRGISQDTLLGYLQFGRSSSWLMGAELFKGENRHSFDQCKLDSLAQRKPNSIVYCAGLTMCLLVDPEAVQEHRADLYEKEQANKIRSSNQEIAICEVHQFSWRPVPATSSPGDEGVLLRVSENRNRILSSNFVVDLEPPEDSTSAGPPDKYKLVRYQGFGHGVKVRLLDDTIGRPSDKSPLTGLRYLTATEDSTSVKTEANSNYAYRLDARRKQEHPFRQCHMACQMDEFCESFSVCKPTIVGGKGERNHTDHDCVLSTMRLNRNKVDQLQVELSKDTSGGELSVEVTSASAMLADHSEVYKFKRDPACALHPKDILAQFRATKSLELPLDLESTDVDLMKSNGNSVVSLAECAGIANEAAIITDGDPSLEAEFIYCPLESLCLANKQSLEAKRGQFGANGKTEKCFVYTKSHYLNFYDYSLFQKVALKLNGSFALEDDLVQQIGQVIEGLSVEQCARDCNLQQSNCLAFDVCEFEANVTICTLYSIRSPLAPATSAGWLPVEQRFHQEGILDSASLVENGNCAHFHLKDSYFGLKINHMLEGDDLRMKRHRLDQLERKILDLDQKRGDTLMVVSILGSPNGTKSGPSGTDLRPSPSAAGWSHHLLIHLGLIVSSAILGALGYLYGGQAYTMARDTIGHLRARRGQRFASHRISQLNLPNNQEDL